MTLWQIGLVLLLAGATNALFINLDIGGLPRAETGRRPAGKGKRS